MTIINYIYLNYSKTMSFTPDYVIHPGESLLEALSDRSMTQSELALRTGLTEKHINQIINGKSPISPDTAILLENALGISMTFWNNLQKNYDETLAKLEAESSMHEELKLLPQFDLCYKELVHYNFLEKLRDKVERYKQLLTFYGVWSLLYIKDTEAIAFRKTPRKSINIHALTWWLRLGIIDYQKKKLPVYDEKKLKNCIPELRKLFNKGLSSLNEIENILFECGVWIVVLPYFSQTYVSGVARWVWDNPLVQLSRRWNTLDGLFFTLLHELAHILLHGKKDQFIDYEWEYDENNPKEKEANDYASEILIPDDKYSFFIKKWSFSFDDIMAFSNFIDVDCWIVAWRLAKERYISRPVANKYRKQIALRK